MDTGYFIVSINEDGEIRVDFSTKKELLSKFEHNPDLIEPEIPADEVHVDMPGSDPQYWQQRFLIIKGRLVSPDAKETVVKYEID